MTEQERVERPSYLIRKYGGYYRPDSQGYTSSAIVAGRYTLSEADDITHPNGPKGPRDGMTYIHEDEVKDEDWLAHRAAIAALTVTPQEAARCLIGIVEGINNLSHGTWRDEKGQRLKDTPEWVKFYNAAAEDSQ